jgi:hypothetical protein
MKSNQILNTEHLSGQVPELHDLSFILTFNLLLKYLSSYHLKIYIASK